MSKRARIEKARQTFLTLKSVWRSTALDRKNKIQIFNSNVKSVSAATRIRDRLGQCVTKTTSIRLQRHFHQLTAAFVGWLNTQDQMANSNDQRSRTEISGNESTNQEPIVQQICRRKWRWIEHTLRKPSSDITRQTIAHVEPEWEAANWL